jgi:hypothetical protein
MKATRLGQAKFLPGGVSVAGAAEAARLGARLVSFQETFPHGAMPFAPSTVASRQVAFSTNSGCE